MKIFFDTNVLVAAFTTRGLCADLLHLTLEQHELVTGEAVLEELKRVLDKKFKIPVKDVQEITGFIRSYTVVPKPKGPSDFPIRDPDDAWILASALSSDAQILVTGDDDLLTLDGQVRIPIKSPRALWEILTGNQPKKSSRKLATLGGTEKQLKSVPRRRNRLLPSQ